MLSSVNSKPQNGSYNSFGGGGGGPIVVRRKGSRRHDTMSEHPDAGKKSSIFVVPPPKEWPEVHLFAAKYHTARLLKRPNPKKARRLVEQIDADLQRFKEEERKERQFPRQMKAIRKRLAPLAAAA